MKYLLSIVLLFVCTILFSQTYEVVDVAFDGNVKPIKNINTDGIEFSPIVLDGSLIFTSAREFDKLAYGENNWKNSGYLNVFIADIKENYVSDSSNFKNVKIFSEQIKTTSHTGPVSFSVTGDTIFFTQTPPKVKKSKKKEYRPQLYMATKKGGSWGDIQLLPMNISENSFAHPCYISATQTLYYASDIEGGKGGNDIYSVQLVNGEWQNPINLDFINTESNEVFPFVQNNDIFVASNRVGGKGALDIYWSDVESHIPAQNIEAINTEFDDFGLFLINGGKKGFISCNKEGSDDIFFVNLNKEVTVKNLMAGRFTYRNLDTPVNDLSVMLLNDEGDIHFDALTNDKGEFVFSNLDLNEEYSIKTIGENEMDLVIYDQFGNIVAELLADENGKFVYKKLDYNNSGTLQLIPENYSDFDNGVGFLTGQFVSEKDPGKYPQNMKVNLNDSLGVVAFSTVTDSRGNFEFKNLSLNDNYILSVPDQQEGLILFIFDKKGNVVAQLKSNENGDFLYRKLNGDFMTNLSMIKETKEEDFELDTKTISGNFDYKSLEGNFENGLTVYIYDENGLLLGTQQSNKEGQFRFRNLPLNDNFLFKIEENGMPLSMDDFVLFLEDRYGKKVAELTRGEDGYFIFKPLGFDVENTLTQIDENNLNIEIDIPKPKTDKSTKKVYYETNRSGVSSKYFSIMNKLLSEMKNNPELKLQVNAYADSKGTDDHNLDLSKRRALWIKNYFINRGIDGSRIVINGYGETNAVVNCTDCSSDDLAKNRRSELTLY
jgi:outer membrane protein OmpA-like peptidoglycan-associated protein